MLVISIRIALISNFIFFAIPSGLSDSSNFKPIFKQDELIRNARSKEVFKYMNLEADPCYDFYEFACGNWAKYNSLTKDQDLATPQFQLEWKISNELQSMLEEQVTLEDGTNGRKIKEFYKSCLATDRNGQQQQAFFSEIIKSNGGFPAVPGSNWHIHNHNYNWQEIIAQLRFRYGMDILIGIDIGINYLNKNENSIYLVEPSTIIPAELCSAEGAKRFDIRDRIYEPIEKQIADNLKLWLTLNIEDARKLAADLVTFEFDLCTSIKMKSNESNGSENPNYSRKTLIELTHYFNDSINFNQFVTASYGTPIIKPVFLTSEPYFKQLAKTIQENNETTIANYIMYRALSMLSFPHDSQNSNRPQICIDVLKRYFPKILGEMYHRKYSSIDVRNEIGIMYEKLKNSFENSLKKALVDESTYRVGKKKLSEINLHFPVYEKLNLNNIHIERNEYWHNLAQVMAQVRQKELMRIFDNSGQPKPKDEVESYETRFKYRQQQKRIDIGWGLLQEPFYHQMYPNSMRYAMIGQKLARRLATAFDDLNWTSDLLGLSNWDPYTARAYRERTECFRRQLSNYLHNSPEVFYNATVIRELIAVSGGLNVAFNAYLNWLDFLNPNNDFAILSKETLPELNFTNTQLFFITYAQMFCRADKKIKPLPEHSPLLRHNLERYEVNGPLRNFVEFGRDFRCKAGAEMNPADKCVIY